MLDKVRELVHTSNGHIDIERTADGTRLALWTRNAGGVTRPDLSLAHRVDTLIEQTSPLV